VIVCPRCSKENQDHYKFCLGCGAELPRDAAHAPKSFTAPTPPAGMPAVGGPPPAAGGFGAPRPAAGGFGAPAPAPVGGFGAPAPAPAPAPMPPPAASFGAPMAAPAPAPAPMAPPAAAPAPAAGGDQVKCSNCGNTNNRNFKFCGTCGAPLAASVPAMPASPPPAAAPIVSGGPQRGSLVLIRADGSEGDSFPLSERTVIGREAGGLFASDSYLSPRHATFVFGPQGLTVTDEASLNGVYLRIAADTPTELRDRSIFRIGQEIIRFERLHAAPSKDGVEWMGSPNPGFVGRICLVIGRDTNGNCYPIPAGGLHLGRERGDILFPDDGYVSGLHCRLHEEGGRMFLTDVGSSNGTFIRLTAPVTIPSGSLLLLGQQLFRAEF
jgi:pSer/pThr/pTyr-binding forkhead associated (FHA) protein